MGVIHHRSWIATVACVAVAAMLLCWFCLSESQIYEKKVTAAEDEVYEVVIRDIVAPNQGRASVAQLVFDDTVLTELGSGAQSTDITICKENLRASLRREAAVNAPEFDSLADKAYHLFTRGWYDGSPPAGAVHDFIEKACTVSRGRLSQTFHTDLPRTFIAADSVRFTGWPVEKEGTKSFEHLFPGAGGIISFSRVGLDSDLHAAIVSTSFICGGLCGSGSRYILREEWGRWRVVNKWMIWVS